MVDLLDASGTGEPPPRESAQPMGLDDPKLFSEAIAYRVPKQTPAAAAAAVDAADAAVAAPLGAAFTSACGGVGAPPGGVATETPAAEMDAAAQPLALGAGRAHSAASL